MVSVEVTRHGPCRLCKAKCHVVGCFHAQPLCEALRRSTEEGETAKVYAVTVVIDSGGAPLVLPVAIVAGTWADVGRWAQEHYPGAFRVTAECLRALRPRRRGRVSRPA